MKKKILIGMAVVLVLWMCLAGVLRCMVDEDEKKSVGDGRGRII